jgi:tetratricopeptide (TPR) repeat protein
MSLRLQARFLLLLGRLLARFRFYGGALRFFQQASNICPESAAIHSWVGWANQHIANEADALAAFDRALQIAPTYAYAHAQKGRLLASLGRNEEAVDELLRAGRMDPQLKAQREYLLALGSAYGHLDLAEESLSAYETAYRLFPTAAEAVYGYGWSLYQSRRFEEAERVLRKAVRSDPNNTDAHYNLASVLAALERWNEASDEFRETIRLDPQRADALVGLGGAYRELREFDCAAETLERAIQIRRDNPDAFVQIGTVYSELGRWEDALEAGKRLRELLPDHEIGYWLMSSAYCQLERYTEAIQVTEANLRQKPNSSPALEGLGYIYLKSERFADAIPIYERAIASHPDAPYLKAQLAAAYLEIGDTVAALKQHQLLVGLDASLAQEVQRLIDKKRETPTDVG